VKIPNKKILKKSLAYRVYASLIAQIGVFLLFGIVELNFAVLVGDVIQFFGYYVFEWLWNVNTVNTSVQSGNFVQTGYDELVTTKQ
jgi:uncharacterized membrane protein